MASMPTRDDSDQGAPSKYVTANFKGEFVYLSFVLIGSTLLLRPTFEPVQLDPAEAKAVARQARQDSTMFGVSIVSVK